MGFDAVAVLVLLLLTIAALAFTRIAADAVLVACLGALLLLPVPTEEGIRFGVLGIQEAFAGFGNPGLVTVAILFIVVAGLRETGGIDWIAGRLLGRPRSLRMALARLIVPVSGMSAFLNNTPIVAMMIPAVSDWARKQQMAASKLMIPLSYASIMGGTCTLIGTSTNLVVGGLVLTQTDLTPLRMFDITWVGLPSAIVGAIFLITIGPRLLPSRTSATSLLSDPREYSLELIVPAESALAGKSVEQAGLRNLPGCYLAEIERGEEVIPAVGPEQMLRSGDRLLFVGVVDAIRDVQKMRGLAPATNQVFKLESPRYRRRLFEAVVAESCPIVGQTIRKGRFRSRYDGAVIAVARNAERVRGKVGDIVLQAGDVLLVEAEPAFGRRYRNSRDFLLVSPLEDSTPRRHERAWIAVVILVTMVALATAGVVDLLVAALLAAGLMVVTRCCTIGEARRSIDWSVLIVIGASLGIGRALEETGGASTIAQGALAAAGEHPWVALAVVYLVTMLLTEVITNNAAVALMFPFALATAAELEVSFMPFAIAMMMAGSASFATPIGYQTNLMVYGPGGYEFRDFLRIGIPMNALMAVMTIVLAPLAFPF